MPFPDEPDNLTAGKTDNTPSPADHAAHHNALAAAINRVQAALLDGSIGGGGGGGGAVTTDRQRQLYNATETSLRKWNAAKAAQEANPANSQRAARVLALGDSTTLGGTLNSHLAAFPSILNGEFKRIFGESGSGIVHLIASDQFQQDGSNAVDNRVNRVGVWTADARAAFGAGAYSANGITKKLKFTDRGDSFSVYYVKGADGGTFTVDVDGGTAVGVDSSGADGLGVYTVTGLSLGTHVITVTAPAANKAIIHGFEAKIGSTGVRVTKAGHWGAVAAAAIDTADAGSKSLPAIFDTAQPDLTTICFGLNEYLNAHTPVATYKGQIATLIARARGYGDVLLMVPPPPQDLTQNPAFTAYVAALYALADEQNVALLDLSKRWGSYAIAQPAPMSLYQDVVHPNARGHVDWAKAIFDAIGDTAPSPNLASAALTAQTFTGLQTLSAGAAITGGGLAIAAGQIITFGGDTTVQRDSGFILSTNAFWKAARLFANGAGNRGALNTRGVSGGRALSCEGTDGVERGGFGSTGRPMIAVTQSTVGAAGGASAIPGAPSGWEQIEDVNGVQYVRPYWLAA